MSAPRRSARESLLVAAENLFSERGYAAVGTREIVRLAGVNISAIKYYFGSKRELYLETIARSMLQRETAASWDLLPDEPESPAAAARALVRFIRDFLDKILVSSELNTCTRLLLQETMHPSEAIDKVVDHFADPRRDRVGAVVAVIAPGLDPGERGACASSVMSQFVQYALFRPFLEQGTGQSLSDPAHVATLADHIARFCLRGLAYPEERIETALVEAAEEERQSLSAN